VASRRRGHALPTPARTQRAGTMKFGSGKFIGNPRTLAPNEGVLKTKAPHGSGQTTN